MTSFRQRWVSLLSMAAFLIANTPASAVAVRCPWVLSSRPVNTPKATLCANECPACCCCENPPADPGPVPDVQPRSEQERGCPACPAGPSCPHGCCWCSVAKVPCCSGVLSLCWTLRPCLGPHFIEGALLLPPAPPQELTHPPRA